jgi:excisionase family DNA binding protein
MPNNHAVLTLAEAAKFLLLSPNIIEEKAETGKLPGHRAGRTWRFSGAALEGWLRGRNTGRALLEQVGAFKDDPTFLPMIEKIYIAPFDQVLPLSASSHTQYS